MKALAGEWRGRHDREDGARSISPSGYKGRGGHYRKGKMNPGRGQPIETRGKTRGEILIGKTFWMRSRRRDSGPRPVSPAEPSAEQSRKEPEEPGEFPIQENKRTPHHDAESRRRSRCPAP